MSFFLHLSTALLICRGVRSSGCGATPVPDSQAVLRSARRAQAAFELMRRRHLPQGPGPSGGCDARIGRLCYWYAEGDSTEPAEPPAIRAGRERLLAALAQAAALQPGDEWIAGQRVRYLLEAGQPQPALAAARDCRATPWWCEALAGLALHAGQDFASAGASFDGALRDMPPPERCRWADISLLLEGELRKAYERSSCEARAALAARWWWLATPLFSARGNDRRTEHFARVTLARIEQSASNPYGLGWGEDLRELLLRYGEPSSWTKDQPATALHDPAIAGHERAPSFRFGPPPHALTDLAGARPEDWDVVTRAAHERYAPRYATHFVPLAPQVAVFRRGESLLVAASYDLSHDSLFAGRAIRAALVLAHDDTSVVAVRHDTLARGPDVLLAMAPWEPFLVSLEIVAANERRVARARLGVSRPGGPRAVSVSDVLLFDPPDSLPATLSDALAFAYGSARVPPGRRLGLFWEIYGLDSAGEAVTTELTLTPERGGWLERAARSVGLRARRRAVRLEWEAAFEPRGNVVSRALAFDLSGIRPGRYRIDLTVIPAGAEPVTATREFEAARR